MLPFAPGLAVRPLAFEEWEAAGAVVNHLLLLAPFSAALEPAELQTQLFDPAPPTVWPVEWQVRRLLGAWRAGELVGLLDVAVGLDSESLLLPDRRPVGLLRFLALPQRQDLVEPAAALLLDAAHDFWYVAKVEEIKAFHLSTGYPSWQGGAGLLPGDWSPQVRALTEREFRFAERYYLLARPLEHLLEENVPQGGLSLAFRGGAADRRYQVFFRRTELIAECRLLRRLMQADTGVAPFAYIAEWEVDSRWRNQKLGRWLLRRMINDATQQGLARIAVHVPLQQGAAINLLAQHSFEELNYRGYSLSKSLPPARSNP